MRPETLSLGRVASLVIEGKGGVRFDSVRRLCQDIDLKFNFVGNALNGAREVEVWHHVKNV